MSVLTKNLNWDGFKDGMGWGKNEKFLNYAGSLKTPIYRGFTKNQYIGSNFLTRGEGFGS